MDREITKKKAVVKVERLTLKIQLLFLFTLEEEGEVLGYCLISA